MDNAQHPPHRRGIDSRIGFESLIASISRRFACRPPMETPAERKESLDRLLDTTLQETGEYLGVDRGYIMLLENSGAAFSNTHTWVAEDTAPLSDSFQHAPFDRFPWLRQKLLALQPVAIPYVRELPEEATAEREEFERLNILSLLLVPMVSSGNLVGFFGFDTVRHPRKRESADTELLQIVGEMMTNALIRDADLNAIQEREERLRLTLEATTDGVLDYDIIQQSLVLSESAARIAGLETTRITDCASLWSHVHPDDVEHITTQFLKHRDGHAQWFEAEIRIAHPDGDWRRIVCRATIVSWQGSNPERMLGTLVDVSELRRAESSRQDAENKYRQLFEMQTDAIFVIDDAEDTILEANAATEGMYGYARKYLLGMKFFELAHESERDSGAILLCGEDPILLCQTHRHRDGSSFPVEISMRRIPWQGKDVRIAAVRDISERFETQQELDSHRLFLQTIIEAEPSMIMVRDKDRRAILVNAAACHFHGKCEADIVGRTGEDLLPSLYNSEPFKTEDREIFAGRTHRMDGEYKLQNSQGETCWMRIIRLPLRDMEGNVIAVLSVGMDLTEEKQLKAELVRTGQLASLGELAAGFAHEINNPVNGIINYAQVLLDMMEDDGDVNEVGSQFLGKIITEGERIARLAHGVLGFARNHASEKPPCFVHSAVRSVIELVESRLNRDGISLTVDTPEDLPPANCVTWELQQVLMNLISNARFALNKRYAPHDPEKKLIVSALSNDSQEIRTLTIMVEDRGSGIDPNHLDDVFDPFFTTKPEGEGTGLGLSICRSIISEHRGSLVLEQPEQGGTRVVITLPAATEPYSPST